MLAYLATRHTLCSIELISLLKVKLRASVRLPLSCTAITASDVCDHYCKVHVVSKSMALCEVLSEQVTKDG